MASPQTIAQNSRSQALTPLEIARRSGLTILQIADRAGLSPSAVHNALRGRHISARSQAAVAAALDMTPNDLFGDLCHPHARRPFAA